MIISFCTKLSFYLISQLQYFACLLLCYFHLNRRGSKNIERVQTTIKSCLFIIYTTIKRKIMSSLGKLQSTSLHYILTSKFCCPVSSNKLNSSMSVEKWIFPLNIKWHSSKYTIITYIRYRYLIHKTARACKISYCSKIILTSKYYTSMMIVKFKAINSDVLSNFPFIFLLVIVCNQIKML